MSVTLFRKGIVYLSTTYFRNLKKFREIKVSRINVDAKIKDAKVSQLYKNLYLSFSSARSIHPCRRIQIRFQFNACSKSPHLAELVPVTLPRQSISIWLPRVLCHLLLETLNDGFILFRSVEYPNLFKGRQPYRLKIHLKTFTCR